MSEIWKDIKELEGVYQISNFGRVKSLRRETPCNSGVRVVKEKILKSKLDRYGYPCILLTHGNFRKNLKIHRLVAMAFLDNKNDLSEVNHKDFDKTNNLVDNLEWVNSEQNMAHYHKSDFFKIENGNYLGEFNPNSKLSNFQINLIRKLRDEYKIKISTLSCLFSVSISQINRIIHNKQWKLEEI